MTNFIIPTDDLKNKFEEAYESYKQSIQHPNILLLGQTGVGKSSLINTVFGNELASVSNTKPETRGFHCYTCENVPINIIDSEGYELGDSQKFKESLSQYIDTNFIDISKQIHIAWYCISISSARVLPYDLDNIDFLLNIKKIPTCVVFTQCDNDTPEGDTAKALTGVINKRFGKHISCFQTSNDSEINKSLDLESLIDWSLKNLSNENLRTAFLIAQKVALDKKDDKAKSRIKYYAGLAAAIGVSPIPLSDAIALTALQIKMTSDIFTIYGLNTSINETIASIVRGKVLSLLGKTIAGNLIKMIPGLGTYVGAIINSTVATTITYSLGYALCCLTKKAIENNWDGDTRIIENLFTEENIQKLIDAHKRETI